VIDADFGALLSMHLFSVPTKLVKWMMKRVDPLLSEFRYKNRVIIFNCELICKILGLENNARVMRISGDSYEVIKLKELYRDGDRAKIGKCISIATESKDRETFMRSFSLLALGSVYNPGTGNDVSLKYLNNLENVELINTDDWAGHILKELMDEVKKYQKFSPERLEKDHQIGSCLIILAVWVTPLFFSDIPLLCAIMSFSLCKKSYATVFKIYKFVNLVFAFSHRLPIWTTLICHPTEATKSTTVYPAPTMSETQTSTLMAVDKNKLC
jgi:hypothetical protein